MKCVLALAWATIVASFLAAQQVEAQTLSIADSVQTYSTLTGTTVTMTGKSELHVTGTSNPISGSTINLNSHDSWFWLDNIRPATVSSTYLSRIKVNGAAAVHGTNVRIVQYGMGTVVTPFTNAEQPLETFTDPGFNGTSKLYSLYTYYDTAAELGLMYRNISSFKLKRGYMATFGTAPDGTGTSKVYIAQDHDVNVGVMPNSLDNAVQFVRVFPWRWVSKKGGSDVSPDTLNATWHYDWNNDKDSTLNWEYVPIRQQRWWPAYPTDKKSITCLSGFNEPDNYVEDSYQTLNNGDTATAVAAYPELEATGLRVGSPACTDGGRSWLYDFMDKANAAGVRIDYITIHFYWCGQTAAQLKAWLQEIHDYTGKPIWLTEFNNGANWTGCGDPTYSANASVIDSWINMMDSTSWIERYCVYSNVESVRNMVYSDGSVTPAGALYRDQKPPIGYIQEAYPLAAKRGVVQLPLDGHTHDQSGFGNGGVSYGVPVYVTGQRGQALEFDGSSLYVKLPEAIADSSSFTFAAWVYWDGGADNQRIFDFGNDTSQFFYLTPGAGGQMRFGLRNGSSTENITAAVLPTGSWQHVAVTMQGTMAKLYLNGVLQTQGTLPDAAVNGTLLNYLGKSQWDDPLFSGRLDEVVIADSAWTQDQIAALMTTNPPPFQVFWKGDVNSNWSTNSAGNTNWASADQSADAGTLPVADTDVILTGSSASNVGSTVLGANFSIAGLSVTTSSAVGIGGAHDLTVGSDGINVKDGAGATTINTSGQVKLAADQSWTSNSSNGLTVSSVVSGSATLSVAGTYPLTLTGTNTFSGAVNIFGGGSVKVPSVTNALGSASIIRFGGGGSTGALIYTGTGEVTSRALTFNGGYGSPGIVLDQSGSGLLKFTANTASAASVTKTLTLQGSTSGVGEFAGTIANGGSTTALTKSGSGTWILSGSNTYTGTTTLNTGTLAIGHNAAFGTSTVDMRGGVIQSSDATARTISNAISLSADTKFAGTGNLLFTGAVAGGSLAKTFTVNNSQTEFRGVINGSGARTKAGPGTLIFSGANTYTGATTVNAGTLAVNRSLAAGSAVTIANGATLTGTGSVNGSTTFADGSRFKWSLPANSGTTGKLSAAAVNIVTGTNGAAVDLVFNGTGSTVNFNDTFWTQVHTWTALSSSGMTGKFTLGVVSNDSLNNPITNFGSFHLSQNSTGVKVVFAPVGLEPPPAPTGLSSSVLPGAVALTWNAAAGADSYNILRSTTSGGPYEVVATEVAGTGYTDRSVVNGTTYYYVIDAVNPGGESVPTAEITAMPHLPSTFDKAGNTTNLNQSQSWVGSIAPGAFDTARWTSLAGANSVLLGADASWNGIIVAAGGGPVSIGAGNTLTTGTAGLNMSAATQNLTISSNLTLGPGNQVWNVASARTLTLNTGTFTRSAGATLNVQGTGTVAASMTGLANDSSSGGGLVKWATVGTGANTKFATLSGGNLASYTLATSTNTWGFTDTSGTTNYTITAASATTYGSSSRSANTILYTGGTDTLTPGNTNSGAQLNTNALINAGTGTLSIALGTGLTTAGVTAGSSKELILVAANAPIIISARIHNSTSGTSSLTVVGPNTVTLSGTSDYTGGTCVNSGTLSLSSGSALGTGTLTINGGTVIFGNQSYANAVAGVGAILNNVASAAAVFTGDHSGFTGTLTQNSTGNTQFNSSTAGSQNAAYTLTSGEIIFALSGANYKVQMGSLATSPGTTVRGGNSATGITTLEVGNLNSNTTIAGALNNGSTKILAFTKVGPGILTLTGTSNYTGATTINAGTLMVNGALTGTSAVLVNTGGTLAGTGTSSGPVTVFGGATLSPGNGSGGVLTISGTLTLGNDSVLDLRLGSTSSRVAIGSGGAVAPNGATKVNVTALNGFGPGTYSLITGASGIDASSFAMGTAPAEFAYALSGSGNTLSLTVTVPLTVPAGLTATGSNSAIGLSWATSPAATGYNIKRSTISGDGYVTIASAVTGTNYFDTGLAAGTTYFYMVSAVNLAGESDDSDEVSATALTPGDAWRQQKFGTTANTGNAADNADPDQDGLSNLMERGLGSEPNATTPPPPQVADENDRLTITFTRNVEATDVVITVLGTDDLVSGEWEELARSAGGAAFTTDIDGIPSGATVNETGTGTTRSVKVGDAYLVNDPAHSHRFLRLQVDH